MRKKIFSIFALGALLLTASCSLHDDNEIFDTPAAQRMEETIANDKALLESATNGWKLVLWMGEDYSAGGYTYFLKFNNDKVTAGADIASPSDWTTASSYDVIADEGPVLTFNTYNEIFHYLANPESDGSQVQQDYEFIITRTTNDSIYLTGKKYGNKMVMTRVADGVSWTDEIDKIKTMEDSLMYTYKLCNGTDSVGYVELSSSRVMDVEVADSSESIPYCVTAEGITLQRPITVNGQSVQNLRFDGDAMTLTSLDPTASALNMQVMLPDNYMNYDEFAGNYRLNYWYLARRFNVTLTPAGDGKTYLMSGFVRNHDVVLTYHKASGGLRFMAQQVGTSASSGNPVYMLGVDNSSFYFSLQMGYSLTKWMGSSNLSTNLLLAIQDITGMGINGFYLAEFTGSPSSSTYVGVPGDVRFADGSNWIRFLNNLTRIN